MSSLDLKTYPDKCLRIKTRQVESFDAGLEDTLRAMADVMYLSQGVGLAATQVGLGLNILVIDAGDGLMHFINPEIVEKSREKSRMEEGCLSVPGITVNISRSKTVKIRAQNEKGEVFVRKFEGLISTALQHEMDHLHGKIIIDYLDPIRGFIASRKLKAYKRRNEEKAE